MSRSRLFLIAGCSLASLPSLAAIDGVVNGGDGYFDTYYQDTQTGFGDNSNELDGLFAVATGSGVQIGLTGNLSSGNAIVMYFDTVAGGQNVLSVTSGPGYVQGQNGMTFETGFTADFAIAVNRFNNDVYYDVINLQANSGAYQGTHAVGGGGGLGFGSGYFDDTNTAGVTGGSGTSSGASATTGFEFYINQSVLGYSTDFCMMAMLTNNGNGFSSNQVLTGIGGGGNLGWGGGSSGASRINFANISGNQCTDIHVVPEPATLAALGAGLAALLRRKRKA